VKWRADFDIIDLRMKIPFAFKLLHAIQARVPYDIVLSKCNLYSNPD
jgi:hypothetical protein